jgi:hypothetical protein
MTSRAALSSNLLLARGSAIKVRNALGDVRFTAVRSNAAQSIASVKDHRLLRSARSLALRN